MDKDLILIELKKRKSAEALDFFIALFLYGILIVIITIFGDTFSIFLSTLIYPFLYFGLIPYITNGSTIGGLLMGIQIIFFDSLNRRIYPDPLIYIKRFLKFTTFNRFYIDRFIESYKINSRGQLSIDEQFNTTVISKKRKIDFSKKLDYYIFEANRDNLREKAKKIGFFFKWIVLSLFFIPILLSIFIIKFFN